MGNTKRLVLDEPRSFVQATSSGIKKTPMRALCKTSSAHTIHCAFDGKEFTHSNSVHQTRGTTKDVDLVSNNTDSFNFLIKLSNASPCTLTWRTSSTITSMVAKVTAFSVILVDSAFMNHLH